MNNSTIVDLNEVISENGKKLEETSTDMLVDMFANPEKEKQDHVLWNYNDRADSYDHDKERSHDHDRTVDDDINNYEKKSSSKIFKKDDQSENDTRSDTRTDTKTYKDRDDDDDDDEDVRLKKLDLIRKLGELRDYGATISQNYNLDSDLKSMEYEYKLHTDIRSKRNAVTWMSHMMIGIVRGVEILNDTYNPFEIKLGGLTTKVNNNLQAYYDVLGEIYEKYNKPGKKMAPELRLLLMISGAGLSLQLSRFMPNMLPEVSKELKNNEDTINDLKDIASKTSDRHRRDLDKALEKDRAAAKKKIGDMEYLRNQELEYRKLQREDVKSLHKGLELSESIAPSGHSKRSKRSKNRDVESTDSDRTTNQTEDEKMMVENLAMKEKIQELEHEKRRKILESRKEKERRKLIVEKKKLSGILNMMNNDIDNYSNSSESSISINPEGIDNILSKRANRKRAKARKVERESSDSDLDSISIHDISISSSKKGKKGKENKITTE